MMRRIITIRNWVKRGMCVGALLWLSACRVGPRYQQPIVETPVEWKHVEEGPIQGCEPDPLCLGKWWLIFNSELLNSLEERALRNNPNLYTALARIAEAWATAGVNRADLFPEVDLTFSYNKTNELFKIYLPSGFNFPGFTGFRNPYRIHEYEYMLPFNIRYEVDLWGKYRHQYDSAVRNAQAQEEAYQAALLSLTTNVASGYYNLRTLDATLDVLLATIAALEKGLEIAEARYKAGLVTYADVSSARVELCNAQSSLEDVARQRGLQENVLASLLGVPASELELAPAPLDDSLPHIPPGLPSAILRRRPDIAEAERTMASQHALIGVAYASFFPSFELTTSLGFASPLLKDLLTWQGRFFSLTINALQTIFDAGRRRYNLRAAWARFAEATGEYQQQVITAFREVEDALNDLEFQEKGAKDLFCSVEAARRLTQISRSRYQIGVANYIEVVVNERSQLDAERAYVMLLGSQFQATIQLIKALGGGWDSTADCTLARSN
jgi:outer membrane protein, multidrug efflux system